MKLREAVERVDEAPIVLTDAGDAALADLAHELEAAGFMARVTRGTRMRSVAALFDEVSASLQFPPYFGGNWDAFDECLGSMALPPRQRVAGLVVFVVDAEYVLADESPMEFATLVRVILGAHADYSAAVRLGESWDRPPLPFHFVMGCRADVLEGVRVRLSGVADARLIPVARL